MESENCDNRLKNQLLCANCNGIDEDNRFNQIRKLENTINKIENEKRQLKQELFASKEIVKKLKSDFKTIKKSETENGNVVNKLTEEIAILKKQNENYALDHIELKKTIQQINKDKAKLIEENSLKKKTYLDLELENYEKSINDLTQEVQSRQQLCTNLKSVVENQEIINSELRNELSKLTTVKNDYQIKCELLNETEFEVKKLQKTNLDLNNKIEVLENEINCLKIENSTLLKTEQIQKDAFNSKILLLKNSNKDLETQLNLRNCEYEESLKEFNSYKIRAQSILQQNSTADSHAEDKLNEEIRFLQSELINVQNQLSSKIDNLSKLNDDLKEHKVDKEELLLKSSQLINENEELLKENKSLRTKIEQVQNEIRHLQSNNIKLTETYKQQIQELENKLDQIHVNNNIYENNNNIGVQDEIVEYSDSISDSINDSSNKINYNGFLSEKTKVVEDKYELQAKYLANLLSETEEDLRKYVQMNKLLKDEIRKYEKTAEREKHAENLEYLKNIIFKFATLNNGEERVHLINVLNTMLKFSPNEVKLLTDAARGKTNSWSNLIWS